MLRISWFALRSLSSFNRLILRRFTPAGRMLLALLAGAAVLGIDTERSMTYQAFTLVAALFALGLPYLGWFRPRIEVSRILPPFATAGEPCTYRLRLTNQGRDAQRDLTVADNLADRRPTLQQYLRSGAPPGARSFIERHSGYARWRWLVRRGAQARPTGRTLPGRTEGLAAGQSVELECAVVSQRRGVVRFESVTLARPDPFGLIQACRDLPQPQQLHVLPRRYRLPQLDLPGSRRYQRGGVALAVSVGDSEEFASLREYRPGDPLQRVHWKSFARTGVPIVKEFQDEFFERHCVVFDTAVAPQREDAFEEAISVVASFVCAIDTRECLLDLLFVGERVVSFSGGRGRLPAERLLVVLAAAQPAPQHSFDDLAQAVIARRSDLTSTIVVSAAWDEARSALCARLLASGVSVCGVAVVQPGEQVESQAAWLKVVEVGRIQADLMRAFA